MDFISKSNKIRVGVIGIGGAAQVIHIPILASMDDVELVGFCDEDDYKAGQISDKYRVKGFVDPQNLLKGTKPDVVLITTPPISHLPLALASLRAGAHVIIEKPVTRDLSETSRLADAAQKSNKYVFTAMNLRFRQDVTMLGNFLSAGELGKIWRVKAGWLKHRSAWARSPWLDQRKISGGGVLMDLGIQMIDFIHWLLDKPAIKRISGYSHNDALKKKVEDTISINIDYENGINFQLDCSWALMTERSISYAYFEGTDGAAQLNPLVVYKSMQGEQVNVTPLKSPDSRELYQASFESQMKKFMLALRGETEPESTIDEALETMKIIDLVYQSASKGREIIVENA